MKELKKNKKQNKTCILFERHREYWSDQELMPQFGSRDISVTFQLCVLCGDIMFVVVIIFFSLAITLLYEQLFILM